MKCENPQPSKMKHPELGWYDVEFRCRKCDACLLMRRAEKVCRMILECQAHDEAMFITLTYDDENLPLVPDVWEPTLDKKDAIKFIKRLRRYVEYHYNREIRVFLCGEYGGQTGRPHYHAIVWGIGTSFEEAIDRCWNKGLIHVGTVTPASMSYVAWYTTKVSEFSFHTGTAVVPEFTISPRRPAMGENAVPILAAAARKLYAKSKAHQESISPTELISLSSDLAVSQNFAIIQINKNGFFPLDRFIRDKLYATLKAENEDITHEIAQKHKILASHQAKQKWGFEFAFEDIERQADARKAHSKLYESFSRRNKYSKL